MTEDEMVFICFEFKLIGNHNLDFCVGYDSLGDADKALQTWKIIFTGGGSSKEQRIVTIDNYAINLNHMIVAKMYLLNKAGRIL